MNYSENFARNIRILRKERGLTQKAFACTLGYSEKTVSKWECGESIPTIETLFDIAKVLQTGIETLFRAREIYYLGIDGGGTKTALVLADNESQIIRSLQVQACNPVDIGFEASKEILKAAIYEICGELPFSSVCMFAGIAGGTSAGMQERFREFFSQFGFLSFENDSDNRNIIAAGLGPRDGITLILGTGICAYAQKAGKHTRTGGWGYLIDNGGSGYNLGRDALNAYFCALDGSSGQTALTAAVDTLYPGGAQAIMAYIYKDGKRAVASFAPAVFAALEKGDAIAEKILHRNMEEAAHILETAALGFQSEKIPVILAGGLTNQPAVVKCLKEKLTNPKQFEISILSSSPVKGAVMLAMRLCRCMDLD